MHIEDEEYRGFTIEIHSDEDPMNPREWDNLGTMVCWHNHYILGDEQPKESPDEYLTNLANEIDPTVSQRIEYWENDGYDRLAVKVRRENPDLPEHGSLSVWSKTATIVEEKIKAIVEKALEKAIILPLYLYDHSGITMNTSGFHCPWDSGQVGFIYILPEKIKEEYSAKIISPKLRKRVTKYVVGEVETYDNYLTGAVYGYIVKKDSCEVDEIHSVWGYFGYDNEKSGLLENAKSEIDWYIGYERKKHFEMVKTWIKNKVPFQYREAMA